METDTLEGRTAIVTGATRGIGKALALRLADLGVDVTVTGKTVDDSDKEMEGTIHKTAEAVEERGAEALPIRHDVRDEDNCKEVVDETVEKWGGLDILINNAGAIQLTDVENTPPNRYDLLMEVNARGTYVMSHYALPHLRDNDWGHVLTASPPIATDRTPGRTAYGLSKIGMTFIAQSLAGEVEDEPIAVNAFWPLTAIDTRATRYFNMGTEEMWRTPEILCDMVEEIVQTPPNKLSGEALLDEPFLRERGYDDFEQYNVVEGSEPPPLSAQLFGVDVE
jgi:citronellol/citronellal dehydrogenase